MVPVEAGGGEGVDGAGAAAGIVEPGVDLVVERRLGGGGGAGDPEGDRGGAGSVVEIGVEEGLDGDVGDGVQSMDEGGQRGDMLAVGDGLTNDLRSAIAELAVVVDERGDEGGHSPGPWSVKSVRPLVVPTRWCVKGGVQETARAPRCCDEAPRQKRRDHARG